MLMNVMVSFAIIALLSTLSIPYIRKYQTNLKLNSTARDLTSDLRYAQQLSVTEQIVHKVAFHNDTDSYEILRIGTSTTTIKTVNLDDEISFSQITGLSGDCMI